MNIQLVKDYISELKTIKCALEEFETKNTLFSTGNSELIKWYDKQINKFESKLKEVENERY